MGTLAAIAGSPMWTVAVAMWIAMSPKMAETPAAMAAAIEEGILG